MANQTVRQLAIRSQCNWKLATKRRQTEQTIQGRVTEQRSNARAVGKYVPAANVD